MVGMSRKNIVYNYKPIIDGDMSQVSIKGEESNVAQYDSVTYEFKWSGGQATNGDIGVEYSKDEKEPRTWRPLDFGTLVPTDGASDSHLLVLTLVGFKFTRPFYTRTNAGATGTMNVSIFSSNKGA